MMQDSRVNNVIVVVVEESFILMALELIGTLTSISMPDTIRAFQHLRYFWGMKKM